MNATREGWSKLCCMGGMMSEAVCAQGGGWGGEQEGSGGLTLVSLIICHMHLKFYT